MRRAVLLVVALLFSAAAPALAQRGIPSSPVGHPITDRAPSIGVAIVPGTVFTGFEMSYPDMWNTSESGARACAVADCWLVAPLILAPGSTITALTLHACNMGPESAVKLIRGAADGAVTVLAVTNGPNTIPCSAIAIALPAPHVVQDDALYILKYELTGQPGTNGPWLQSVRVSYDPVPVSKSPTFADVPPSHPFYGYIEAVAAAGITGGCGGGNFCPDATVTRGQMAVFLSRGLGLFSAP